MGGRREDAQACPRVLAAGMLKLLATNEEGGRPILLGASFLSASVGGTTVLAATLAASLSNDGSKVLPPGPL